MNRRRIVAVSAAVVLGTGLVAAPAAGAAVPSFHSAGYALTGAHQVTASFIMPTVTCGGNSDRTVSIGVFGPTGDWEATASVYCDGRIRNTDLEIGTGHSGQGEAGPSIAKPGHVIVVSVSGLKTARPAISLRDANVPYSKMTAHLSGPAAVDVGAFADSLAPFSPPITMHASVNSGQPFISIPHPRHNETRGGTTLIKTGGPSGAGTHFALYFRHH